MSRSSGSRRSSAGLSSGPHEDLVLPIMRERLSETGELQCLGTRTEEDGEQGPYEPESRWGSYDDLAQSAPAVTPKAAEPCEGADAVLIPETLKGIWADVSPVESPTAPSGGGRSGNIFAAELAAPTEPRLAAEPTPQTVSHTSLNRYVKGALKSAGRAVSRRMSSFRNQSRQAPSASTSAASTRKSLHQAQNLGTSWYLLRTQYSRESSVGSGARRRRSFSFSVPVFHDRKRFVGNWDMMVLALICYTAFVVPYRSAFMLFVPWDGWHVADVVMDCVFVLDMLLQFNITYYSTRRQVTVLSRANIIKRYLKGGFSYDLISVFPLEMLAWLFESTMGENGGIAVRTLSLLRLFRLTRLGRILKRVEASNSINYGAWTVLKFLLMTVILSHWVACAWGLLAVIEITIDSTQDSWMTVEGAKHGLAWDVMTAAFDEVEDGPEGVDVSPEFFLYTLSMYFAVYSLASVGYGDLVPVTPAEQYFSCCVMILGAFFLGYIVASITSVVATRNAESADYYRLMDQLNRFMDEHQLDSDLRVQLRNYFQYRRQTRGMQSWNSIITQMSPSLRKEVFAHTSCKLIQDVEFFKNCDPQGGFLMDLGMSLETNTYTPQERIINIDDEALSMYIVRRGVVASEGNIFMRQDYFGIDMLEGLLRDSIPKRNYMSIALTYADVLLLSRASLERIMEVYPEAADVIRSRILRRMLQREVRAYTSAIIRILTGRRPRWAIMRGDSGGREQHYYKKLLLMIPEAEGGDFRDYLEMVAAAKTIQRAFRHYAQMKRARALWLGAAQEEQGAAPGSSSGALAAATREGSISLPMRSALSDGAWTPQGRMTQRRLSSTAGAWQQVLLELETLKSTIKEKTKQQKAKDSMRRRRTISS
uniref:Potassium voltage-gated channel Eag-related subfamily H member 2 n=1 Tax=Tetraselmis sp. GSL018 TaxID=582737 RepID=A0A061R290_9CHLO